VVKDVVPILSDAEVGKPVAIIIADSNALPVTAPR
jgi:hypothetical protein